MAMLGARMCRSEIAIPDLDKIRDQMKERDIRGRIC